MKMKTDIEIIDGAIDLIQNKGWIQNTSCNSKGVCMGFALFHQGALVDFNTLERVRQYVKQAMTILSHGKQYQGIVVYNDTKRRTKRQVLNVLRKAKELAESNV